MHILFLQCARVPGVIVTVLLLLLPVLPVTVLSIHVCADSASWAA
jgi:ABC-type proline/glycine betaine transport system permease subunit